MRRAQITSALLSFLSFACGTGESADVAGAWTTTVDTLDAGAGPVLVVNSPPPNESLSWTFEEIFRVGGAMSEGPTSFARISQIAVDSRGRLAVLDWGPQELRIFGADGGHLRTLGGKGSGPGEFDGAFGLLADGDDFLVAEQRNARISFFTADSGFTRSIPTRFFGYGLTGWDAIVDSAGRLSILSSGMLGNSGQHLVRRYDRLLTPIDTFPYRPYEDQPEWFTWQIPRGRGTFFVMVPLLGRPNEVLDGEGRIWRPDERGEYRLRLFVPPGDTVRVVEVRRPRRPVTAAERDSVMDELVGTLKEQGMPTELDWSLLPEFHPGVQEISRSDEGDLWVRTSPMEVSPTNYDVLDPEGRFKGTASIPGRVKPGVEPVVRGDRIWAVVIGDLDVESVLHGRLVAN